ncbi:MAG TPA: VanW family protein [Dermatophilaceae bacterium]|nr:VanW family protein [Dermatophilaceae bacterium]
MSRSTRLLLILLSAVVVLAAAYAGLAAWAGQRTPAKATVTGIPVGGLSEAAARSSLAAGLAERGPIPLELVEPSGDVVRLAAADVGLAVDVPSTVRPLVGFSLHPARIWERLTGGSERPLVAAVDRARLRAAVDQAAARTDQAVREGSVSFAGGRAVVTTPVVGVTVDRDRTVAGIAAAWPARTRIDAVATTVEPKLSAAEIDRAVREFAQPAMSGPVRLRVGARRVVLAPTALSPALSMRPDPHGRLLPVLDANRLAAAIRAAAPGVEPAAKDATVRLVNGRPRVLAATNGVVLDAGRLAAAVLPALTSTTRAATVPVRLREPRITTAEAKAWRVTEIVSSFTSVFPTGASNAARTHNIGVAIRELNGTLVEPGQQFSLNAELGQRTPAKGYQRAPVIYGGRLSKDYGGGVSQVSTTVYNAAYFAGMRLDEHTPHSFYISRYPEGREATVSWPNVHNKWTNTSGYGILIESWVEGNAVRMRFWGTKIWHIESVKGPRVNYRQPREVVDDSPTCVPQSPQAGFDVTVTRLFQRGGRTVKQDSYTTHYIAEDDVTCTHPDAG